VITTEKGQHGVVDLFIIKRGLPLPLLRILKAFYKFFFTSNLSEDFLRTFLLAVWQNTKLYFCSRKITMYDYIH